MRKIVVMLFTVFLALAMRTVAKADEEHVNVTIDLGEGYYQDLEDTDSPLWEYNGKSKYVFDAQKDTPLHSSENRLIGGERYKNEFIICPENMYLYGWEVIGNE